MFLSLPRIWTRPFWSNFLWSRIYFQALEAEGDLVTLKNVRELLFKYFVLTNLTQILSSCLRSFRPWLAKKNTFTSLVLLMPNPPSHLGRQWSQLSFQKKLLLRLSISLQIYTSNFKPIHRILLFSYKIRLINNLTSSRKGMGLPTSQFLFNPIFYVIEILFCPLCSTNVGASQYVPMLLVGAICNIWKISFLSALRTPLENWPFDLW